MEIILAFLISVLYAFGILVLFGATIFVHELGHFLVAKKCGLQIDAFAIGMGPAMFQKKVNGIVYKICWLPIGGYVALPQMDATGTAYTPERGDVDDEEQKKRILPHIAPGKRIAVAVAGAAMNVLFALVLSTIIWKIGVYKTIERDPFILGMVEENSAAAELGLQPYDQIVEVNGRATPTVEKGFGEIALNRKVTLTVLRGEETFSVTTNTTPSRMKYLEISGMTIYNEVVVGLLSPGFPAEEAGLEAGDVIVSVNGEPLYGRGHFVALVREFRVDGMDLTVERRTMTGKLVETLDFRLLPKYSEEEERFMVGIGFLSEKEYPTPSAQLTYYASSVFRILKAVVNIDELPQVAKTMQSPLGIMKRFWEFLHIGLPKAIWFTALINVNLAILNLLPIPILDGGHVTYALLELVSGKKIKEEWALRLTNIFGVLLLTLMAFLMYKDVDRFIIEHKIKKEYAAEAAADRDAARKTAEENGLIEMPIEPDTSTP